MSDAFAEGHPATGAAAENPDSPPTGDRVVRFSCHGLRERDAPTGSEAAGLGRLTHLTLDWIDSHGLRAVADGCPGIRHLHVRHDVEDAAAVKYFLHKARNTLRHLLLFGGGGDAATDDALEHLDECRGLETLVIANAMELGRRSAVEGPDDAWGRAAPEDEEAREPSEGMAAISRLSNLTYLELGGADALGASDFVRAFGRGELRKLVHLHLGDAFGVDDEVLRVIADHCPDLTHVSLHFDLGDLDGPPGGMEEELCLLSPRRTPPGVSNAGLDYLLFKSRLRELVLGGIPRMSVTAFAETKAPLRKLVLDEECEEALLEGEGVGGRRRIGSMLRMMIPSLPESPLQIIDGYRDSRKMCSPDGTWCRTNDGIVGEEWQM